MTDPASIEEGSLTLHLLDPAQGQPLQSWRFVDRKTVTIGRGSENDIAVADPQVSRTHVRLQFSGGAWTLVSLGRNGTRVDGETVAEFPLTERLVFQLGVSGPIFRFLTVSDAPSQLVTCDPFAFESLDFLSIDESKKARDVEEIAGGDAFLQIEQRARELKRQRVRGAPTPLDSRRGSLGES